MTKKEFNFFCSIRIKTSKEGELLAYELVDLLYQTGGIFLTSLEPAPLSKEEFLKKFGFLIEKYKELHPIPFEHPLLPKMPHDNAFSIACVKENKTQALIMLISPTKPFFTKQEIAEIAENYKAFITFFEQHFKLLFGYISFYSTTFIPSSDVNGVFDHLHWYNYIKKKMIPDIASFKQQLPDYFTIQEDGNFWEIQAKQSLSETLEKPIFFKLKQPLQMVKDI